jgi:hypothetical protein
MDYSRLPLLVKFKDKSLVSSHKRRELNGLLGRLNQEKQQIRQKLNMLDGSDNLEANTAFDLSIDQFSIILKN